MHLLLAEAVCLIQVGAGLGLWSEIEELNHEVL
eukprot:CAMPEP_0172793932 /NCGR_PEP_ID=MMETSP1074-20121228/209727_1 /TAXON_ID=2916 /ORGANISM="Ceratium fusus, Strain PA161109" /LENGTH=32 /DNA_ID= /DNA_START= /DNA_END= /DNA_ORIENTATION=